MPRSSRHICNRYRREASAMAQKTKPNCCPNCNKTHEECSDKKACPKWEVSLHVCKIFGTRPQRPLSPRRRITK
uniref:Uncharacterized protein n=7 Tax=Rimavirus TaxID=2560214 RepID=A0A8F3E5H5_9CAUD